MVRNEFESKDRMRDKRSKHVIPLWLTSLPWDKRDYAFGVPGDAMIASLTLLLTSNLRSIH